MKNLELMKKSDELRRIVRQQEDRGRGWPTEEVAEYIGRIEVAELSEEVEGKFVSAMASRYEMDEFIVSNIIDHYRRLLGESGEVGGMKNLVSPSWWCRWFGCKKTGPYYGMPQSHCWNCGMKTGYANPALNLPDFVVPAAIKASRGGGK